MQANSSLLQRSAERIEDCLAWRRRRLKPEPALAESFEPAYNGNSVLGGEMGKGTLRSCPDRKISETFLHFAAPLLRDLPSEALERRVREALQVSFTVWNAVIFADVLKDHRHLDEIQCLTGDKPEMALLMEEMIGRKRALFSDDPRLIGNWEVTRTADGLNLHVDARDPHSLPRKPTGKH